jgi:hypothetical protein
MSFQDRRYRGVPDYRQDPTPALPTDATDWLGLRRFLEAVSEKLFKETKINDPPPTTPTGVTLTALAGGNQLVWQIDPATTAYFVIYRNTSTDLLTAMDIGAVRVGLTKVGKFFDNKRTEANGTPFIYWIYPYSANNVPGQPATIRGTCWTDS